MSGWATDNQGNQYTSDKPHAVEHGSLVNKSNGNGTTTTGRIVGGIVVESQ